MRLPSLALAAVLAATATSANATIMLATWSATISRVGPAPERIAASAAPGPDLVGTPFELRLKYDTELGVYQDVQSPFEISRTLVGDRRRPLLEASMTYGGQPYEIALDKATWSVTQGSDERFPSYATTQLNARADLGDPRPRPIFLQLTAAGAAGVITTDITREFSFANSIFGTLILGQDTTQDVITHIDFRSDAGRLTVVQLDPEAPGVPEPATWALMITGFGLTGAVLRRRRFALA